jgi:hypothetical protein
LPRTPRASTLIRQGAKKAYEEPMCGEDLFQDHHAAEGEDEYVLDIPTVWRFIEGVRATIADAPGPKEATEAIRPAFARLLADRA